MMRLIVPALLVAVALLALKPTQARAAVQCGPPNGLGASVCSIDPAIDPAAVCNDGTVPAFWMRPGHGSGVSTWLIWLQGGGSCVDKNSCTFRSTQASGMPYITSNGFTATSGFGVLSTNQAGNPSLYNANVMFVHYCSSDDWTGGYSSPVAFNAGDPTTWNFQGRRIALAAITSLREVAPGFGAAARIVLGGSSAGGLGMTLTVNDILPSLPPAPSIVLVNDAGFSLDIGQYDASAPPPFIYAGTPDAYTKNYQAALALWHGRGDVVCAAGAVSQQDSINCYNSAFVLQHGYITLPTFVAESQLDTAQLPDQLCPQYYGHCNVPADTTSSKGQYALAFAADMASTLIGAGTTAAYTVSSPNTYEHIILSDAVPFLHAYPVAGGNVAPRDVLDAWLANPTGARVLSFATGPGVTSGRGP